MNQLEPKHRSGNAAPLRRGTAACLTVFALLLTAALAYAQDSGGANGNAGPVRLARFAYLRGDVTWRSGDDVGWTSAAPNMPLRQGAQIWTSDSSRAEIQFDDGSRLRLDSNTLLTLQTLYSDADGEFTEISLNDGEVYLRLNNKYSLYQVNTAVSSLKASGPARLRIGSGNGAQYAVRRGSATVEGANDKAALQAGDYLDVVDANTPYTVHNLPRADAWDAFNDSRDRLLDNGGSLASRHLPSNIALVGDDLDAYGAWHNDPNYGYIWVPRGVAAGWRPYSAGHWTWVEPFGWTWVASEAWGWAPYHYGTWVSRPYGWGWCPGPATQYWSPAVVSFHYSSGGVAWCPLAPREVRYPSTLAIGFHSGNWSAFFSIGGAAVYYPTSAHYCEPRPWSSGYVNHVTYVRNVTNVTNITNVTNNNITNVRNVSVNRNTYLTNTNFVSENARAQGGTFTTAAGFAGRAAYQPVTRANLSVITRGRSIAAPVSGAPVAGPQQVQVTRAAFSPTRSFRPSTQVQQQVSRQAVYRAALPASVPRTPAVHRQQFITPETSRAANRPGTNAPRPRPNVPNGVPGGVNSARTNPTRPDGTTRPNSGLDAYLRERNAGRTGTANASRPNGNSGGFSPGRRDNSDTPRAAERPSAVSRPGGVPDNRGFGSAPTNRVRTAGQVPGDVPRRPLHTNRTASRNPGARPDGSHGGGRSDPRGGNPDAHGGGGNRDGGGRGGHDGRGGSR